MFTFLRSRVFTVKFYMYYFICEQLLTLCSILDKRVFACVSSGNEVTLIHERQS